MVLAFVVAFAGVLSLWRYLQYIEEEFYRRLRDLEKELIETRKTMKAHLHVHDHREPRGGWLP